MRLDDTVFSGIIKALGAIPDNAEALRRRQAQRYHVDREISIKPYGMAGAASRPVTLVNISAGGVCIVDRVAISTGDRFLASLPVPGGGSMNVLCIARQSRLTPTRAYRVGAEFMAEKDIEQPLVRGGNDILAKPKRPEAVAEPAGSSQPAKLLIGDRAVEADLRKFADGIFEITAPEPVTPGEQVIVEFHFQERRQAWNCTVTELRELSRGRWSLVLSNDGPADLPAAERGSWIKRLFRRT